MRRAFVEHQQARRAHQRPRHRYHLLLAAAHRAGELARPLGQFREALVGAPHPFGTLGGGREPAAQLQVLLDRHLAEELPALGHQRDAAVHHIDGARFRLDDPLVQPQLAGARQQAGDRLQQRGLAGAVRAEDDRQTGPSLQRQVAQHRQRAIAGAQAFDAQVRRRRDRGPLARHDRPSGRGRRAKDRRHADTHGAPAATGILISPRVGVRAPTEAAVLLTVSMSPPRARRRGRRR